MAKQRYQRVLVFIKFSQPIIGITTQILFVWEVYHKVVKADDCGDYIRLRINYDGTIENWPEEPDFSDFIEGARKTK